MTEMHLPPHLAEHLFGHQQQDPERERQIAELQARASRIEEDNRRLFLRFGAIMCTCNPVYDAEKPSAVGCVIHGGMMLTEGGELL